MSTVASRRYALSEATRKALFAEWRKLAPSLDYPGVETDDKARHLFTREALGGARGAPSSSWKSLTEGQGKRLLRIMKERNYSAPDYRAMLIAKLAADLFGCGWLQMLLERIWVRFQVHDLASLTPGQAHAEIEELMSRIARRDGVEIEIIRKRFARI